MAQIEVDRSEFPFVFVRFGREPASDAEVLAFLDEMRRIQRLRQPFVLLVDAGRLQATVAKHRKMYADWVRESKETSREYCVLVALVVSNALLRGALQAVLWLVANEITIEAFATLAEAAVRTADVMREQGLENADAPLRLGGASAAFPAGD